MRGQGNFLSAFMGLSWPTNGVSGPLQLSIVFQKGFAFLPLNIRLSRLSICLACFQFCLLASTNWTQCLVTGHVQLRILAALGSEVGHPNDGENQVNEAHKCIKLLITLPRAEILNATSVQSIYVQVTDNKERGNKVPCPVSDAR